MSKRVIISLLIGLFILGTIGYALNKQLGRADTKREQININATDQQNDFIIRVPLPEGVSKEDVTQISKHEIAAAEIIKEKQPGELGLQGNISRKNYQEISKRINLAIQEELDKRRSQKEEAVKYYYKEPIDYIIILVDKDGNDILPDLEAAKKKQVANAVSENEITFTWDSPDIPWDEEALAEYQEILELAYPMMKEIYGHPAFNITINISLSDDSTNYSISLNEIRIYKSYAEDVNNTGKAILIHESIHGFHDDLAISNEFWEEGQTQLATSIVANKILFNEERYLYPLPNYEQRNNPFSSVVSRSDYYQEGASVWSKFIIKNRNFLKDFNANYYAQALNGKEWLRFWMSEYQRAEIVSQVESDIEGHNTKDWLSIHSVMNSVNEFARNIYLTLLFAFPYEDNNYLQATVVGYGVGIKREDTIIKKLRLLVSDHNGQIIFDKVIAKDHQSWIFVTKEFSDFLQDDPKYHRYTGRLKFTLSANVSFKDPYSGEFNDHKLETYNFQELINGNFMNYDYHYRGECRMGIIEECIPWLEEGGIHGLIAGDNKGTIIIQKLDDKGEPIEEITFEVINGIFYNRKDYQADENSKNDNIVKPDISRGAGTFLITYNPNKNKQYKRIITKTDGPYFIPISTSEINPAVDNLIISSPQDYWDGRYKFQISWSSNLLSRAYLVDFNPLIELGTYGSPIYSVYSPNNYNGFSVGKKNHMIEVILEKDKQYQFKIGSLLYGNPNIFRSDTYAVDTAK